MQPPPHCPCLKASTCGTRRAAAAPRDAPRGTGAGGTRSTTPWGNTGCHGIPSGDPLASAWHPVGLRAGCRPPCHALRLLPENHICTYGRSPRSRSARISPAAVKPLPAPARGLRQTSHGTTSVRTPPSSRHLPASRRRVARLRLSAASPSSLGVSRTIGCEAKAGSFNRRTKPASPSNPAPMCVCLSLRLPHGTRLSFT